MLDRSPLTTLLESAIRKKPALAFYSGYQDTLEAINRGGQFNLAGLELMVPGGVYPPRPGSATEFFCEKLPQAHYESSIHRPYIHVSRQREFLASIHRDPLFLRRNHASKIVSPFVQHVAAPRVCL
jgi:hypothetical protein